ncbi:MAG TPA: DMT family transporter [Patescibacteria group bacterium]|nr:DMT family transporter [Patescibacteria group bacterium]
MKLSAHLLPFLALLLSGILWGASTPANKLTLEEIPPFSLAFLRFLLATVILTPVFLLKGARTPIHRRDLGRLIVLGLFGITLNIGTTFVGLTMTTGLDAVAIFSMVPLLVAVASSIFLGEKLTKTNLFGQILALAGVGAVALSPTGPASNRLLGDALLLISAISVVFYIILSKELFRKYHSATITGFIFLVGVVTFAPLAGWELFQNPDWITGVTHQGLLGLGFIAIFTSVVAYLAFEWGLEHSTASLAGLIEHVQLLFGAVLSAVLLNELLSTGFVLGSGLILVGIVFATRPSHHFRKAHAR